MEDLNPFKGLIHDKYLINIPEDWHVCPSCGFNNSFDDDERTNYCAMCGMPLRYRRVFGAENKWPIEYRIVQDDEYSNLAYDCNKLSTWIKKAVNIMDEADRNNNSKIFPNKEMRLLIARLRGIFDGI